MCPALRVSRFHLHDPYKSSGPGRSFLILHALPVSEVRSVIVTELTSRKTLEKATANTNLLRVGPMVSAHPASIQHIVKHFTRHSDMGSAFPSYVQPLTCQQVELQTRVSFLSSLICWLVQSGSSTPRLQGLSGYIYTD